MPKIMLRVTIPREILQKLCLLELQHVVPTFII